MSKRIYLDFFRKTYLIFVILFGVGFFVYFAGVVVTMRVNHHTKNVIPLAEKYLNIIKYGTEEQKRKISYSNDTKFLKALLNTSSFIPKGEVKSHKLLAKGFYKGTDGTIDYKFTFQEEISGQWLLSTIVIRYDQGKSFIYSLDFFKLDQNSIKDCFFKKLGISHVLWLVLVCFVPLFILFSMFACCYIEIKKKAIWLGFMSLGVVNFCMNWDTGKISIHPISIKFMGSGIIKGPAIMDPWIVSTSIPVFAILFWLVIIDRWMKAREDQLEINLET